MTYETICQLFILALLGLSCARIFFAKNSRPDYLAVLPVISFIISILNLLAFGISVFGTLVMILAFFISSWNSNALSRLEHNLVLDGFSIFFTISSIIYLILVIVLSIFIVLLRPAKIDTKKYEVKITSQTLAGSFEEGFGEYKSPKQNRSMFIKKYVSKDESYNPFNESRVIFFVPGELSKTDLYEPTLVKLAHDGYTVYSADFYSKDLPWFGNFLDQKFLRNFSMLYSKTKNLEAYTKATSQKTENFVKEVLAMINQISLSRSDKIFIVGDGESLASYATIKSAAKNKVRETFDLSDIPSYSTPGYGPVESTNPLLAKRLGLERDGTFYMSSHIANLLEKSIDESLKPATVVKTEVPDDKISDETTSAESTESSESSEAQEE